MTKYTGNIAHIHNARRKRSVDFTARMTLLDENRTHGRASAALEAVQRIDGCRWPLGEIESPEFRFCGAKREHGSPYCCDCGKRAYTKNRPPSIQAAEKIPAELRRRA